MKKALLTIAALTLAVISTFAFTACGPKVTFVANALESAEIEEYGLCVGKNATEITALMASDNYGTADVKAAGCTILVNGLVKAASKIG